MCRLFHAQIDSFWPNYEASEMAWTILFAVIEIWYTLDKIQLPPHSLKLGGSTLNFLKGIQVLVAFYTLSQYEEKTLGDGVKRYCLGNNQIRGSLAHSCTEGGARGSESNFPWTIKVIVEELYFQTCKISSCASCLLYLIKMTGPWFR